MRNILLRVVLWLFRGEGSVFVINGIPIWFVDVQRVDLDALENSGIPGTFIAVLPSAGRPVRDSICCFSLKGK